MTYRAAKARLACSGTRSLRAQRELQVEWSPSAGSRWSRARPSVSQPLAAFRNELLPGRFEDVRPPNAKELKATTILAMPIDQVSAKVRYDPEGLWGANTRVAPADLPFPDADERLCAPAVSPQQTTNRGALVEQSGRNQRQSVGKHTRGVRRLTTCDRLLLLASSCGGWCMVRRGFRFESATASSSV